MFIFFRGSVVEFRRITQMTKQEFKEYWGFSDEGMRLLERFLEVFGGKIISIDNIEH